MKTWKQSTFFGIVAMLVLMLTLVACDNDNGNNDPVLCTCPEGTTHEPNETCCNGTDCECGISEPEIKEFTIDFSDVIFRSDYPELTSIVTIKDTRTACGSANLDDLGIIEQIQTVIPYLYNIPIEDPFLEQLKEAISSSTTNMGLLRAAIIRTPFSNVFVDYRPFSGGDYGIPWVIIIIENNMDYESYRVDNRSTLRFNINYLTSVSDDDLKLSIVMSIREMNAL
jgi:hypothetical protein